MTAIIPGFQIGQQDLWKQRISVFVTFALADQQAVVGSFNIAPLKVFEFGQPHASTIKQPYDGFLAQIGEALKQLFYLSFRHHCWQHKLFAGIQFGRKYKGFFNYMLKKKAASLGYTAAFGPAYTMHLLDENNVLHDVLVGDLLHLLLVVILKQQAHLHGIVAYRTTAITCCNQYLPQLIKPLYWIGA